jgi:hypothetical protein
MIKAPKKGEAAPREAWCQALAYSVDLLGMGACVALFNVWSGSFYSWSPAPPSSDLSSTWLHCHGTPP